MTTRKRLMAGAALIAVLPAHLMAQDYDLGTLVLGDLTRDVATDTATAETTLDQEELDARQASTLAELMTTVPGVTLSNASTPAGSTITMRGVGADGSLYGSNTTINVVVDGVSKGQEEIYRQGGALAMEPELFKEVKVIRGPSQGFRWSTGAIGGTVEVQTKDAADFLEDGDDFALRTKLAYDSNSNGKTATAIVAWQPTETFDVIGFVGYRTADEYTDGSGNAVADSDYAMPSYLVKAKKTLGDDVTITGSYSYNETELSEVDYNILGTAAYTNGTEDILLKNETAYVALNYAPAGNDLIDLTAKLVYSDEVIENLNETDISASSADNRTVRTALSVENEAYFTTGVFEHTLLTGVEIGTRERSSLDINGTNASSTPGGTTEYKAAYVTDEMVWGGLTLTPQLRFEKQTITPSEDNTGTGAVDYDITSQAWAGALSARYEFNSGFAVFGTYAQNSNLPITDDLGTTREDIIEEATTYEVGLSYEGSDLLTGGDQFSAKLTAFQTTVENNRTYAANVFYGYTDYEIEGTELELSYKHPAFYADFNATKMRGEYLDNGIEGANGLAGTNFDQVPADRLMLTVGKQFMDEQLDLSVQVRHDYAYDRAYNPFAQDAFTNTDAFTVANVYAAYTPDNMEGVEFRAGVENLFDTTYKPYLSSSNAPGRTLKLSVAKTF